MSKFASKESLQYLWKKSKTYTDEKMADMPCAAGYVKKRGVVIDNLESGEYKLVFYTAEETVLSTVKIIHKAPVSEYPDVVPDKCKYIGIYSPSGELKGRMRTDTGVPQNADFNENDPSSPAYIAGRTHWNDYTELLPETALTYSEDMTGYPILSPVDISGYSHCTVKYNGTEYVCPVLTEENNGEQSYIMGNIDIMTGSGDSGHPFVMLIYPPEIYEQMGIYGGLISVEGITTGVTLAIGGGQGIKKLDNSFLNLDWVPEDYEADGDELQRNILTGSSGTLPELNSGKLDGLTKVAVYYDGKRFISHIYSGAAVVEGMDGLLIGNVGFFIENVENTGEPFLITVNNTDTTILFTESGKHNISVYKSVIKTSKMPDRFMPESIADLTLRSSTAGSTKVFRLTVDDSGTLTVTEKV